jgi:hypothetical protein
MRSVGSNFGVLIITVVFGLALATAGASARERLTEIGARLAAVDVDKSRVTVSTKVATGADVITGTFVTAHTATGRALQRNHLGFWIPWDGKLASMADNRFAVADGQVSFKILKDEDMSAELFPVRITLAYRTQTALKFGVFELREDGPGVGR